MHKHSEEDNKYCFKIMTENEERLKFRRIIMNDDAVLYENNNSQQKRDALNVLNEYIPKFKWTYKEKILDIGCADGSVTKLISTYCPDFELMEGCDVNVKAIKHAAECYGSERMTFRVMDIEADLPQTLEGKFDHVFSFYTLHWINDQEKAFQNIYDLMPDGGECLLTFLAQMPIYQLYKALKWTKKWRYWLQDIELFYSPYHNITDPDVVIELLLNKIGYQYIDVRCKQKQYLFHGIHLFRNQLRSINPFKVGEELEDELLNDIMQVAEDMRMLDRRTNTVNLMYNLIVVHCRK